MLENELSIITIEGEYYTFFLNVTYITALSFIHGLSVPTALISKFLVFR